VALEPNWQEGEQALLTLRAQAVLAQGRAIMLAGVTLHNALETGEAHLAEATTDAIRAFQARAATMLGHYADGLVTSPPSAQAPRPADLPLPSDPLVPDPILSAMRNLVQQLSALPDWQLAESESAMMLRESHGTA
jgi:multidrug resistance protein MdtO